MGKKYIIELEDEPFCQEDGNFVYKVKGFNNIVFSMMDFGGLGTLTPYTAPDLEQVRKEAYKDGYNAGFGKKIYTSYQEGLSDAWNAARKIFTNWCISDDDLALIFGKGKTIDDIMREFTASEAIEKIRQYEQEKEEIIDPDKNKVEALANDIGIHKLYALVKEIRGE